jgi:hypothetical protein
MKAPEELTCCRCGIRRPADEFAWRRKVRGQRDTFCRPCRSAYGKEHYKANKQRYIDQARAQKQRLALERTTYLLGYFASHPCIDCGETDPLVLEFDHLRDKRFDISRALASRKWESILAEIEKCQVVCSNCHRRRTYRRMGSVRAVLTQALLEADDEDRTRASSLEGSRATATPRPQDSRS